MRVATADDVIVRELSLEGSPEDVLDQTASHCIALLEEVLGNG